MRLPLRHLQRINHLDLVIHRLQIPNIIEICRPALCALSLPLHCFISPPIPLTPSICFPVALLFLTTYPILAVVWLRLVSMSPCLQSH